MYKFITSNLLIGFILLSLPAHTASYKAPEAPKLPPIQEYAETLANSTFGEGQWVYFEDLIERESGWTVVGSHYPVSKKSTASGLGGFLDKTWKTVGCKKTEDPYIQID